MRRQYLDRTVMLGVLSLSGALLARDIEAQQAATTHTIFMNAIEFKGSTTTGCVAASGREAPTAGVTFPQGGEHEQKHDTR